MHILVTGGAGFIGSSFIRFMRQRHPDDVLINLDALTYAGNLSNLADVPEEAHYHFVHGSILDHDLVVQLIKKYQIDAIVNFAAESHVDRSIADPLVFVDTNIRGTATLLAAARETKIERFLQVSTDEVYGNIPGTGYVTEAAPLHPSSPYAASKASADLLALADHHTYGLDVVITRCANNYGPYQYPEKLIPLMIQRGLTGQPLPVYGDGLKTRDWLHVLDHCRAIDFVLCHGQSGGIYNVTGNNEHANLEIVQRIIQQLHIDPSLIQHVPDRLGDDSRYALDATKIRDELGWAPTVAFVQGMTDTIAWYRTHRSWWQGLNQG
ncbi:dTDP-glucose 4,6-dehydratase [Schleiferilactobacillus harbinensis]|uniref:dTDP-glucose 4,6-dehydratase n=1 Tax=Schleiferilactobacillus harbinensis TaxID=304207 RepID=UPI00123926F4|nr:dTDP-glucose 4,6-dehydratase [Schleiferilactobacillus harbinensis]QEU47403.1 dTDP-glucose 4,6-dehydratase [Schleiferilactobacillus harbinensis]